MTAALVLFVIWMIYYVVDILDKYTVINVWKS